MAQRLYSENEYSENTDENSDHVGPTYKLRLPAGGFLQCQRMQRAGEGDEKAEQELSKALHSRGTAGLGKDNSEQN